MFVKQLYLKSKVLVSAALALGLVANGMALADTSVWKVRKGESPVTFLATGKPGFLKIRGEGAHLTGKARIKGGKLSGIFDVDLSDLETGINLRDEHMQEKYLETEKFPKARLVLEPLPIDPKKGADEQPFKGKLTLKGVKKPVKGTFSLEFVDAKTAKGEAKFDLSIEDYPIGVPTHLGITMAEKVEVTAVFVAVRSAAAEPEDE